MKILAVDVGTGTQDILLFDSGEVVENCVQLIVPSPTLLVANRIRRATELGEPIVLTGVTMGGGPSSWAAGDHIDAGFPIYATPDAARTFNDDLDRVAEMGVTIVSDDEAMAVSGAVRLRLRDFDADAILAALATFDVAPPDAIAVAVFDHGNAPPDYSDRRFRFDYLAARIGAGLAAFGYPAPAVPEEMTRLAAVASTIRDVPGFVMDTGPAAVLGALEDPRVNGTKPALILNLGNFHTLAFLIDHAGVAGLFEHHTGELKTGQLESFVDRLAAGSLTNGEVYSSQGHGALSLRAATGTAGSGIPVSVTGPRRGLLAGSRLRPYLAVPHGDMMLAGCFGLLRAWAAQDPDIAAHVERSLGPAR